MLTRSQQTLADVVNVSRTETPDKVLRGLETYSHQPAKLAGFNVG